MFNKKSSLILTQSVLALLFSTQTMAAGSKCYGLAFSSGDESAAYQVGAFTGLVENLASEEVAYSVVSGVQGGALNAALLSKYAIGNETGAVSEM